METDGLVSAEGFQHEEKNANDQADKWGVAEGGGDIVFYASRGGRLLAVLRGILRRRLLTILRWLLAERLLLRLAVLGAAEAAGAAAAASRWGWVAVVAAAEAVAARPRGRDCRNACKKRPAPGYRILGKKP